MSRPLALLPLLAACVHHIPDPGPLVVTPAGRPTTELKVCWVEFSTGTLPHGMVVARRHLKQDVVSTASGLVLVHPSGTWLIDGGMMMDTGPELDELSGLDSLFMAQAAKGWTRVQSPQDGLKAIGVDPATLTGAIPTHGHFDHLGGLLELPDVQILLPAAEASLAMDAVNGEDTTVLPLEARALFARSNTQTLEFNGYPALLWPAHHDLFGDGSALLIPLPGHTPGSLGLYVPFADGRALFLVGDTVWVSEGVEYREPKGPVATAFDSDGATNDVQIARLWSLHQSRPDIQILPSHDRRAWEAFFGAPGCVEAGTGKVEAAPAPETSAPTPTP